MDAIELAGKVAVVTGAASGLGAATRALLGERGARVGGIDRLPADDAEGLSLIADVVDTEQVRAAYAAVVAAYGRIDIAVNCAGIAPAGRVLDRDGTPVELSELHRAIAINLVGTVDCTRWAAHWMARNEPNADGERGVVVNVASIAAYDGQIGQLAYSATKGAIASLTLPLARDLASWGIRVVTIAPGIMATGMLAGFDDQLQERLAAAQVFPKRLGQPREFAQLVEAIVANPLLNGEVIRLDAATRLTPR